MGQNKNKMIDDIFTMTATTPMATPETIPWLSSMVVTILVKQPSKAYLNSESLIVQLKQMANYGIKLDIGKTTLMFCPLSFNGP